MRICTILIMLFLPLMFVSAQNEDARSFYQIGRQALDEDNPYEAIESFRSALRLNPSYADARLGMAEALFQLTEYEDAARELEAARPFAGNSRDLILLDARIQTSLGHYEKAAGIYSNLLKTRPHDAQANRGLGEIYSITGQRELADEAYSRSLQYAPGDRRVLLQLVLLHDKAREKSQADSVLMEVLRLYPDNLAVRIQAAEHYVLYDDWDNAMDQLDRANAMLSGPEDKRYPGVALLNAELSLRKGDPAEALKSLNSLEEMDSPQVLFLLARSYRDLGMEEEAQRILSRLLKNWNDDEIARMFREEYLVDTYSGFNEARAESAQWHLKKGKSYEEAFYYARAYNEYRRAKLINKDNPDVWIAYTNIIRKMGFPEHYRDSLNAAMQDIPVSRPEYAVLKERLELLTHSEKNSLADLWDIEDPWNINTSEWDMGVYVVNGESSLPMHMGSEKTIALYLADLLDLNPDISIPMDNSGRNPVVNSVSGFAEAFRDSRDTLDYFVLLSFTETNRTFSASAELFLADSGERIAKFNEMRTGQGRVTDSLHTLADTIAGSIPGLMNIVAVDTDRILLDKGRWQGIKADETWIVVRKDSARPANVEGGLVYSPGDYLGSVEIKEVSEPLSMGIYTRSGDFDFINPGDSLFQLPVPEIDEDSFNSPDPAFKAQLLAIP